MKFEIFLDRIFPHQKSRHKTEVLLILPEINPNTHV